MRKKFVGFITDMVEIYTQKRVSRSAAALSYFLTLTLFPLLICLNLILSSLHVSEASVLSLLQGILPMNVLDAVAGYFEYVAQNGSDALVVMGVLAMLTSSSAMFRSLMNTMSDIQGKSKFKGIFGLLFSFALSIGFLAVIYLSGIIVMSGGWILSFFDERFGMYEFVKVWQWIRFIFLFLILFIMVDLVYVASAPRGSKIKGKSIGAILAAVCCVIVSYVFSQLIDVTVRYSIIYGSLTSIIIIMLWMYLFATILIMGNAFNIVRERRRHAAAPAAVDASAPVSESAESHDNSETVAATAALGTTDEADTADTTNMTI